jgi:hypothetical protein
MQCPYCLDNIPSSALVCKSCRRDLQLVNSLRERLEQLENSLPKRGEKTIATSGRTAAHVIPALPNYRLEAALALAATALLPAALFDLYIGFHLPAAIPLFTTVLAAGAAGLLIGFHSAARKRIWILLGVLLAIFQVGVSSIAFGCVVHAYSLGFDKATRESGAASLLAPTASSRSTVALFGDRWHDPHLWLSVGVPSLVLFVLLAFVGRSKVRKEKRSRLAISLGKRFTPRRPEEEHESFQIRLDTATKIFDGLTHFLIVLIPLLSSLFVIARQASTLTATDPIVQSAARTGPTATDLLTIRDTADK